MHFYQPACVSQYSWQVASSVECLVLYAYSMCRCVTMYGTLFFWLFGRCRGSVLAGAAGGGGVASTLPAFASASVCCMAAQLNSSWVPVLCDIAWGEFPTRLHLSYCGGVLPTWSTIPAVRWIQLISDETDGSHPCYQACFGFTASAAMFVSAFRSSGIPVSCSDKDPFPVLAKRYRQRLANAPSQIPPTPMVQSTSMRGICGSIVSRRFPDTRPAQVGWIR